jgi:hypothetical protein
MTHASTFEAAHFMGFTSVQDAQAHQSLHGGHVFVSNGATRVIWFSLAWTPTPIITSYLVSGVDGKLNPTPEQVSSLPVFENPYPVSSRDHKNIADFCERAMMVPQVRLVALHMSLHQRQSGLGQTEEDAKYTAAQMAIIREAHVRRFQQPLPDPKSLTGEHQ